MRMSITESVQESLVYIGMTKNLQDAIKKQIDEVLANRPPGPNDWLNNAEKEALAHGKRLMVSWAEVDSSQLALYKAALLLAFKEEKAICPASWDGMASGFPAYRWSRRRRGRLANWTGKAGIRWTLARRSIAFPRSLASSACGPHKLRPRPHRCARCTRPSTGSGRTGFL